MTRRDLQRDLMEELVSTGARAVGSRGQLASSADVVITIPSRSPRLDLFAGSPQCPADHEAKRFAWTVFRCMRMAWAAAARSRSRKASTIAWCWSQ